MIIEPLSGVTSVSEVGPVSAVLTWLGSKLQVGFATGLAGSTLSITRRLASIAASRVVTADRRQLRHTYIIDLSVGVGLPIIVMALSYIVQPHRFDILEGYGCDGYLYPCLPTIFIVQAPPIILSLVSACYGGQSSSRNWPNR